MTGVYPAIEDLEWEPGDRAHLIFDLVMIGLLAIYVATAFQLPILNDSTPGPGFFPVLAGSAAILLLAADAIILLVKRQRGGWTKATGRLRFKVFLILAAPVLYLVLVGLLSHTLSIAVVTVALLYTFGRPAWWKALIIVTVTAVGSDLLFAELLGVRMPDGLLDADLSSWI